MNLRATQAEPEPQPKPGPMKFTYPSGSRPLDGYTIKRGIGRGGFGEVYYAASDAGKEVALKLIRRNLDVELRGVTQCLNLKHPNLLGLFDIKQDELGDSWVVMEYVAGDCLEDVVTKHPDGLPREDAMAWFHGIAAGVAYLHDHGIVHRDLKPGNIFCDEGLVKIGDYGLSKFISASRRSGQTESVGTVHYMAPEIGNGRYGKEIDIYALGIILYEMLTGRVPFEGESVGEVLMKHLTAEPDLSAVEEPYRSAIARTLTKAPEGRLQSVGELAALLPAAPHASTTTAPSNFVIPGPAVNGEQAPHIGAQREAKPDKAIVSDVVVVDEEPLWRAVRQLLRKFCEAWDSGRIPASGRMAIIVVTLFAVSVALALNIALIPALFFGTMSYATYFAIRSVVIAMRQTPVGHRVQPAAPMAPVRHVAAAATPPPSIPPAQPRRALQRPANVDQPVKTFRTRMEELTGSMLASAFVAAVMGVLLSVLRGKAAQPEQFAWLVLVSTVGAWLIMIPSKFWEGSEGEPILRRCALLLLGLGLGAFAFTSGKFLMAELPYEWKAPDFDQHTLVTWELYDPAGAPTILGQMAYFAFLLVALRWWRQADPARPHRLSLWSVAVSVFWAWMLYFFWPFPQPWGIMVAAAISVCVQLASPWRARRRRSPSYV